MRGAKFALQVIFSATLLVLFFSCRRQSVAENPVANKQESGDTILYQPLFADGFTAYKTQNGDTILKTSDGSFFVKEDFKKSAYIASSPALAFWNAAGALDSVSFSSSRPESWENQKIASAIREKKILYCGKYSAPDYELLASENCTLAIESLMITHAPEVKEKLEALGIPVFVDRSTLEKNPLGRLEWIVAHGILSGHFKEALAVFNSQLELISSIQKSESKNQNEKKSVAFFFVNAEGQAVVRSDDGYFSNMISLAGGLPVQLGKSEDVSLNLSIEELYALSKDADFIVYNATVTSPLKTKSELLEKSPLFKDFVAVKNDSVWTTTKALHQSPEKTGEIILEISQMLSENQKSDFIFLEKSK